MSGGYRTHAAHPRYPWRWTLCGLAVLQFFKRRRGGLLHARLPLARWPSGITCRNCLGIHYRRNL
jgi:hypothetical protein